MVNVIYETFQPTSPYWFCLVPIGPPIRTSSPTIYSSLTFKFKENIIISLTEYFNGKDGTYRQQASHKYVYVHIFDPFGTWFSRYNKNMIYLSKISAKEATQSSVLHYISDIFNKTHTLREQFGRFWPIRDSAPCRMWYIFKVLLILMISQTLTSKLQVPMHLCYKVNVWVTNCHTYRDL